MPAALGKPIEQVRDGENNAIEFDYAYPVTGPLAQAIAEVRDRHGRDACLLPISGGSAGGGIFQPRRDRPAPVVGLRFDPPAEPAIRIGSQDKLGKLGLGEIVIDTRLGQVSAGAAITLDQLAQALAREIGNPFRVPGADLTSYHYAATGATFMTGGMGPQRRYFSDSVVEAAIFDGELVRTVGADELPGFAGTYGWSGIVGAIRCSYYRYPENEIAFALPLSQSPAELARLLQALSPFCYLDFDTPCVRSNASCDDLILGIEHVSADSMLPLLKSGSANAAAARARDLDSKLHAAGADGLLFVNGCSNRPIDEFLIDLAEETEDGDYRIADISLDHAEVFGDAEEMRSVREAIPYAARMQMPRGRLVYKNHSDANIRLAADCVRDAAEALWRINCRYVDAVERHFESHPAVEGEILVYGHMNPFGIDPHNRVTLGSDDEAAFEDSRAFLIEQRACYYRDLADLCLSGDASFIGGEKTADSELAIFAALGGPQNAPDALYRRFLLQRERVSAAAAALNWRAPELYRETT